MPLLQIFVTSSCVAVLWLEGIQAVATDEKASVTPVAVPRTAFAGSEQTLRFACRGRETVPWQATVQRRTLARGEAEPEKGNLSISLRMPPLKEGVALPVELAVGNWTASVLVLGRDPLSGKQEWAKQLEVVLYDPPGETAAAFDGIHLPYRRLTNLGSLARVSAGMVIVGEGVRFAEQKGLARTLGDLAKKGRPVLVLAAEAGDFAVPDPAPSGFELGKAAPARKIDSWLVSDLRPRGRLRLGSGGGSVVLRVTGDAGAYTWGDFRFADSGGRLTYVAWGLLDRWDASPAPRHFLVRLLEIVSGGEDVSRPASSIHEG